MSTPTSAYGRIRWGVPGYVRKHDRTRADADWPVALDRGAFGDIGTKILPLLWRHDHTNVLGSTADGDLLIGDGVHGLNVLLSSEQAVRKALAMYHLHGRVGLSIGFGIDEREHRQFHGDGVIYCTGGELFEVSLVVEGAFPGSELKFL